LSVFSFFNTGKNPSNTAERFYHGFVLGLIVDLQERYQITSNHESGFGRYDVMLEPLKSNEPAILIARGISKEPIYKYGFAFEGKQVLIG